MTPQENRPIHGVMESMPDVSWSRVAAFVRQHAHDLCNELNGLDLQAALVAEFASEPEARDGLKKMRAGIRQVAADLRALSGKFAAPQPALTRIPARMAFALWQEKFSDHASAAPGVEWTSALAGEAVSVDVNGLEFVFQELGRNAAAFPAAGRLRASARVVDGAAEFQLCEPKAAPLDTSRWGLAPLESTRRGHYGIGLCALARIVAASGGTVMWNCTGQPCELVTTIRFPLAP